MGQQTPNGTELETFALAALLATFFAMPPLLMWSISGTVWFFQ